MGAKGAGHANSVVICCGKEPSYDCFREAILMDVDNLWCGDVVPKQGKGVSSHGSPSVKSRVAVAVDDVGSEVRAGYVDEVLQRVHLLYMTEADQ